MDTAQYEAFRATRKQQSTLVRALEEELRLRWTDQEGIDIAFCDLNALMAGVLLRCSPEFIPPPGEFGMGSREFRPQRQKPAPILEDRDVCPC